MIAGDSPRVSVVLPAKNEGSTIGPVVADLAARFPDAEIIVVNDGSTDDTGACAAAAGARVINHPVSRGNGAAIKAGARAARGQVIAFMDADGQHAGGDLQGLLDKLGEGFDLVVGARGSGMHASSLRRVANWIYNTLASWITGVPIADLTSGFRVARAKPFRSFLSLLPNGFSYPTTSTMAFLRAGYSVAFAPIQVQERAKDTSSHIRLFRDGGRFLIIIFRVGTLYSPLKIFAPLSLMFFMLGLGHYAYTFAIHGQFTNMSALLFTSSVFIFLIGLLSEQITQLLFAQRK